MRPSLAQLWLVGATVGLTAGSLQAGDYTSAIVTLLALPGTALLVWALTTYLREREKN